MWNHSAWMKRIGLVLAASLFALSAWVMNHKMSLAPGGRFYAARQALTDSGRAWESVVSYGCPCCTNDWTDTSSSQHFFFGDPESSEPLPGALVTLSRAGPLLPWSATQYQEGRYEWVAIQGVRSWEFKPDPAKR